MGQWTAAVNARHVGEVVMIDRGLKIVLALGVILGGTAAAWLFRRVPTQIEAVPVAPPPLQLRERADFTESADPASDAPGATTPGRETSPRPPSVLEPLDPGAPPPIMAKSYPPAPRPANSRWGPSLALGSPGAASQARTHKIVDGDALEALAKRYLGTADRAMEIYAANRYVLPGPDVLPIGVELKIPPCGTTTASPQDQPPRSPLAPLSSGRPRRRPSRP